jgi:hypothetical protein
MCSECFPYFDLIPHGTRDPDKIIGVLSQYNFSTCALFCSITQHFPDVFPGLNQSNDLEVPLYTSWIGFANRANQLSTHYILLGMGFTWTCPESFDSLISPLSCLSLVMNMKLKALLQFIALGSFLGVSNVHAECPDYTSYSQKPQGNPSTGSLKLPYMRPSPGCRTFNSTAVEVTSSPAVSYID